MEIYSETFTVSPEGLCTGDLFRLMQDISGHHSSLLGYSEQKMEELGVMWVIIRHGIQVQRWPGAGEKILARTWPGPTRHGMWPCSSVMRSRKPPSQWWRKTLLPRRW